MAEALRSRRADGEATYDRILEAAGEQFAANGFAETTSKAIAAHAGVDLASINYHFSSRNGLYRAVLVEAHRRIISLEDLRRVAAADIPPRAKLKHLIGALVDSGAAESHWHSRIVTRESLSPTSHLQSLRETDVQPKLQVVLAILEEITAIPADDPVLLRCFVSIAVPCAFMSQGGHRGRVDADGAVGTPRDVLIEHMYNFSIGGLEAVMAEVRGRSLTA